MVRITGISLCLLLSCGGGNSSPDEPTAPERPVSRPPAADPVVAKTPSQILRDSFVSAALGVEKVYVVYLPAGYENSDRRYPVIYMLHGLGGDEENWLSYGLAHAADSIALEAIVIMPDGDDSFYVNWVSKTDYDKCLQSKRPFGAAADMRSYCVQQPRYGDYLTVDLINHVDETYRTIAERRARAIGGLSMGGYGALVTGFRRPDLFVSVASHSGVASLRYKGPFPYARGKVEVLKDPRTVTRQPIFGALFGRIFGDKLQTWTDLDPVHLAASLGERAPAIYIDCGTEDTFRLQHGASHLDDVLTASAVEHDFHLLPGSHNAGFWSDRIDDSLRFHAAAFTRAAMKAEAEASAQAPPAER